MPHDRIRFQRTRRSGRRPSHDPQPGAPLCRGDHRAAGGCLGRSRRNPAQGLPRLRRAGLSGHAPSGRVRRRRPRRDGLGRPRRGAVALHLWRRGRGLHRPQRHVDRPHRPSRQRRAEAALPARCLPRRKGRCRVRDRAACWLGRGGLEDPGRARRRRLADERLEDLHHQWRACRHLHRRGAHRPGGQGQPWHLALHRREGQPGPEGDAPIRQARLARFRYGRALLRRSAPSRGRLARRGRQGLLLHHEHVPERAGWLPAP